MAGAGFQLAWRQIELAQLGGMDRGMAYRLRVVG
jgi:hypothetical protein